VYSFDREAYNQFSRRLAELLHRVGAVLGVALAPKISPDQSGLLYEAHDYRAQGEAADFIYLMTYEWGYLYGPPMAVSPINQVRRVLDYAITEIPPGKIMMGMSNYGYNWTLPWRQGTAAKLISNVYAADLAAARRVEIQYDETSQAPWFQYRDDAGTMHVVWFEDPRSIRARLRLIPEYGLRGIFWWNVNQLFRPGYLMYESLFDTVKVFSR
jgi:spore germination protein